MDFIIKKVPKTQKKHGRFFECGIIDNFSHVLIFDINKSFFLLQSLPQTPQSSKSFSALYNTGGENGTSTIENVADSEFAADNVSIPTGKIIRAIHFCSFLPFYPVFQSVPKKQVNKLITYKILRNGLKIYFQIVYHSL